MPSCTHLTGAKRGPCFPRGLILFRITSLREYKNENGRKREKERGRNERGERGWTLVAFTVCCSRLVPLRWLTVIQHPLCHNALPLESQVPLFIVIQSFPASSTKFNTSAACALQYRKLRTDRPYDQQRRERTFRLFNDERTTQFIDTTRRNYAYEHCRSLMLPAAASVSDSGPSGAQHAHGTSWRIKSRNYYKLLKCYLNDSNRF